MSERVLDPSKDFLQSFLIDQCRIRGQMVRLGAVVDTILTRHDYPAPVARLLAELLLVASMLSTNLKAGGMLTLQARGDGDVSLAVVDITALGELRGYAEVGEEACARLKKSRRKKPYTLRDLMGKGYLAVTLDVGVGDMRYQGIVELSGTSLSDAMREYFTQSQQVEMDIRLAVSRDAKEGWHAGGIMIERMPEEGGLPLAVQNPDEVDAEESEDQWRRNRLFMESITESELLEEGLSAWTILSRLFNEDGVWAYPSRGLSIGCRCTRERILSVLSSLPSAELSTLADPDGHIPVHCQFCNKVERVGLREVTGGGV